jgi:hypothetical protein
MGAGIGEAMLVYGLLNPWQTATPGQAHREAIKRLLVSRIGDPRLNSPRWSAVAASVPGNGDALLAVLKRWLTQETVHKFFEFVSSVTANRDQWAARKEFWLAYLNAGDIQDAWFAFGRTALTQARTLLGNDSAYGAMTGAEATHAALILSIGDMRIAEWSHDGACRFWTSGNPAAPALYEKQYSGAQLRPDAGNRRVMPHFKAIPHNRGWEPEFAGFIHRHAGIGHPRWGQG